MQRAKNPARPVFIAYASVAAFAAIGTLLTRLPEANGPNIPTISSVSNIALLTLGLLTLVYGNPQPKLAAKLIAAAAIIGGSFEVMGILTGFPFGHYAYTSAWAPAFWIAGHWFPVPVLLAWGLVAGASYLALPAGATQQVLAAGLFATAVDFIMEPITTGKLGYWHWAGGSVPFQNYVAWFVIAAGIASLFRWQRVQGSRYAAWVLFIHVVLLVWIQIVAPMPPVSGDHFRLQNVDAK